MTQKTTTFNVTFTAVINNQRKFYVMEVESFGNREAYNSARGNLLCSHGIKDFEILSTYKVGDYREDTPLYFEDELIEESHRPAEYKTVKPFCFFVGELDKPIDGVLLP